MAKKRNWIIINSPKIIQEIKANLNNPYVRAKRKNLYKKTTYRTKYICEQKSWKYIGRKHQYREVKNNFEWHEFHYSSGYHVEQIFAQRVRDEMIKLGCYVKYIGNGIKWYGPPIYAKDRCIHCYSKLIKDELSTLYGDWCLNYNCNYLK